MSAQLPACARRVNGGAADCQNGRDALCEWHQTTWPCHWMNPRHCRGGGSIVWGARCRAPPARCTLLVTRHFDHLQKKGAEAEQRRKEQAHITKRHGCLPLDRRQDRRRAPAYDARYRIVTLPFGELLLDRHAYSARASPSAYTCVASCASGVSPASSAATVTQPAARIAAPASAGVPKGRNRRRRSTGPAVARIASA